MNKRNPFRHLRALLALATLASLGMLPAYAVAEPGDLDGTFSRDGQLTSRISDKVVDLAGDGTGVLVLSECACQQFQLIRYTAAGQLDEAFGEQGIAASTFENGAHPQAMATDPDGRIVVVGGAKPDTSGSSAGIAIARFNPDGSLDAAFGNGGQVTDLPAPYHSSANDVVVQPDGMLVVSAYGIFARYTPEGERDPSFGSDGVAALPEGFNRVYEMATLPDGRILAAGSAREGDFPGDYGDAALLRLLGDGSADPSFGNGGITGPADGLAFFFDLAIYPDGRIVASGSTGLGLRATSGSSLARFTAQGELDTSFSPPGYGGVSIRDVAVDPRGGVVFTIDPKSNLLGLPLYRLRQNGKLDRGFAGIARFEAGESTSDAIALDEAGAYLGGSTTVAMPRNLHNSDLPVGELAVARFQIAAGGPANADADGKPDESDKCPFTFARAASGCPRHRRSIRLHYAPDQPNDLVDTGSFRGFVLSRFYGCFEPDRVWLRVGIYKKTPGRDDLIRSGRYGRFGFDIPVARKPGRYYARVKRDFSEQLGTCRPAKSRTITLRRK